jgi:hypothetical protein
MTDESSLGEHEMKVVKRDIWKRSLKNFLLGFDDGMLGSYNCLTDTITIHSGLSPEQEAATLRHELQHAKDRPYILSLLPITVLGIGLIFSAQIFGLTGIFIGFGIMLFVTGPSAWILQYRANKLDGD